MKNRLSPMRVVWTVTLCTAVSLFGDATMYAVLPSQYALIGLEAFQVGWLLSVNRLVRLPLNLTSGWLSDRIGRRAPFVIGIMLGAVSTAGYGLFTDFVALVLLRALWGVAWSLLIVSAYGIILDVSGDETRGRNTGLFSGVSFFGGAIGAMLGGMLADSLGFSQAMLILAACTGLASLGALTVPHTGAERAKKTPSTRTASGWPGSTLRMVFGTSDRRAIILALSLNGIQRFVFAGVFYATFGRYLVETVRGDLVLGPITIGIAALTGSLMLVRNSITILVAPLAGRLSDLMHDRRRVLLVGQILGVLGLASLSLLPTASTIALGVLAIATAYALVPPMLVAWLGDMVPADGQGALLGAYQTVGDLGSGLGPLLAYPLIEHTSMRITYGLSACILALTVPFVVTEFSRLGRRVVELAADSDA